MGWLFTQGQSRKALIGRVTRPWGVDLDPAQYEGAARAEHRAVRRCWKGNVTHSGRLWVLFETRFLDAAGAPFEARTRRWIGLFLCEHSPQDQGWGYKDIDESMGPYEYDCPLAYVDAASAPEGEHAGPWREKVRAHAAALAGGRRAYNAARVGDVLILKSGLEPRRLKVIEVGRVKRGKPGLVVGIDDLFHRYVPKPTHVRRNLGNVGPVDCPEALAAVAELDGVPAEPAGVA
jgi:hypothetical protein